MSTAANTYTMHDTGWKVAKDRLKGPGALLLGKLSWKGFGDDLVYLPLLSFHEMTRTHFPLPDSTVETQMSDFSISSQW